MPSNNNLEELYRAHHATERGEGFVLLGDDRGNFLREHAGTGKRVLDIGCRDGALTGYFSEGNSVVGLDIDSVALARAKKVLGIETRHIDLNGPWDVPSGTFDVVVAAEVVEHLYYPERVFSKIAEVLKPGGIILGTVPNAFSFIHRLRYLRRQKRNTPLADPTHINHFTMDELRALLESHFKEVEVGGLGRLGWLAHRYPQTFAFNLWFKGVKP